MKLLALLLLLSSTCYAIDFEVVNKTGTNIRIAELRNKCVDFLVTEKAPIHLKNNQSHTFKNIVPVVHTYMVCGGGYCTSSAFGVTNAKKYVMTVTLPGVILQTKAEPDHWVGNLECPKE